MNDSNQNPDLENGEDANVTLPKSEYNKLVEEHAKLSQDKANLVSEIKELREKKQLSETEKEELANKLEALKVFNDEEITPAKIEEITKKTVESIFGEKKQSSIISAKDNAYKKFLSTHSELLPDNDMGGLKISAFEKKLSRFNTTNCENEEDFISVYEDAFKLLGKEETKRDVIDNPYASTKTSVNQPRIVPNDNFSDKEKKLINDFLKGDKEKFLKLKVKNPQYIDSLLEHIR